MNIFKNSVENVYKELNDCVIIGLTGRTGSGCTTVSHILETELFSRLELPHPKESNYKYAEERKYKIVYNFMENNWVPFITIEVSSIILSFVFEKKYIEFINYLEKLSKGTENKKFHIGGFQELKIKLEGIKDFFDTSIPSDPQEKKEYYTNELKNKKQAVLSILNEFSCYESKKSNFTKPKEKKSKLYTYLMQSFGNNIRSSGNPFMDGFNEMHFFDVAKRVSDVVEIIKKNADHSVRICIDALRNPYEVYYFRDKYKLFYLLSVSTDDKDRTLRLNMFDDNELLSLDEMEYPINYNDGKIFYQQSIEHCLQIADIHLYNPNSKNLTYHKLTKKLIRYISLMLHPGIVTPTAEERCMQIAYNAKFNSGCLSRQVGAVITDENFYIKAVGWNDVPAGQVPCNLRRLDNYFSENDESTYSDFELTNLTFRNCLSNLLDSYNDWKVNNINNYNLSYCFKDIYNSIQKQKNQVHTRSLHAEENAFLQISKFGGQGIKNGKLFVTASPCELCSKKSYQLGIKDIYYIDPYPGIASSHILKGSNVNNPQMRLFYGAIGNAYVSLYTQRFAIKDELELVSAINPKKNIYNSYKSEIENLHRNIEYESIELKLIFNTRTEIEFSQKVALTPKTQAIENIFKVLNWSGSSYNGTKKNNDEDKYSVKEINSNNGEYIIGITPEDTVEKNNSFEFNISTFVGDAQEIMNPILSHHVKAKTKKLHMEVLFNKESFADQLPSDFENNLYADIDNNMLYSSQAITLDYHDDYFSCAIDIDNPILLYTYSIEWKFFQKSC